MFGTSNKNRTFVSGDFVTQREEVYPISAPAKSEVGNFMQEQQRAAIDADSIKTGVTNDEHFETLAIDIHGFGSGHDPATCTDRSCGDPSHGLSTAGPNFEKNERAGDVYDGQGKPAAEYRDDTPNDEGIASGNLHDITESIERHANGEGCDNPHCAQCNRVNSSTLRPPAKVVGGGGGSRRKSEKRGTKVCDVVGCGLTLCEHVRGRREEHVRSVYRPARVTKKTDKILSEHGLSASDALAITAYAIENGVSFDVARDRVLKSAA